MTHTEIQASVTKTAAFSGAGVDVSGLGLDWTLKLQVGTLTSGAIARFEFDDTTNAFTTTVAGPSFEFIGTVDTSYDHVKSIKKANYPGLAIGIASGSLQLKLTKLTSAASVNYHAWIES